MKKFIIVSAFVLGAFTASAQNDRLLFKELNLVITGL